MAFTKIKSDELKVGMFIDLNLSWFDHPFASSKFKIVDADTLAKVRLLKKLGGLEWDPEQSDVLETLPIDAPPIESGSQGEAPAEPSAEEQLQQEQRKALKQARSHINQAEKKVAMIGSRVRDLMPNLVSGNEAALAAATSIAGEVTDELSRDPDAVMQLINVPTGNEYFFTGHAINVTALSVMLAKAAGLDAAMVRDIGAGAFLHDIGVTRLPKQLSLKTSPLNGPEAGLYREHVKKGMAVVDGIAKIPDVVRNIIRFHHEHCDGSGYPFKLKESNIPLEAKIVAIANRYDNLCNPRNHGKPLPPSVAVKQMFSKERAWYSSKLLDLFIRSLGVYPPGSLVELSDGRTAIVVKANPDSPLKPAVIVYDPLVERATAVPIDLNAQSSIAIVKSYLLADVPKAISGYLVMSSQTSYFLMSSDETYAIAEGVKIQNSFDPGAGSACLVN